MNTTEQNIETVEQIELDVQELDVVDLDDRLELAFRCDSSSSKAAAA